MKYISVFLLAGLLLACPPTFAQDMLVEIRHIYPDELRLEGFALDRDQEVQIEATGVFLKHRRDELILGYAWILDAQSREVVWNFADEATNERQVEPRAQEARIRLPKGDYEVYYASFSYFHRENENWHASGWWRNIWKKSDDLWGWHFNRDDYADLYREFNIAVRGSGRRLDREGILRNQEALRQDAVIALVADDDDFYQKQGFELEKPLQLQIEAVGEARDDGEYDYGWIVNTETRKKVWKMTFWDSEHAGGAEKNRIVNETIFLPAGKYAAIYVSDDSHSPYKWNSPPPYDPARWGMTIHVADADKKHVKKFEYKGFEEKNTIVAFTRLRDDEFRSQGFTLKKPMNLQIYAIGEGRDDEMFDYGWIVEAKTRKKVWEMRHHDTEHAGGSQKNRMVDELVPLDKGSYLAYFVTDDSHSYWDWNASPPYDQERWGITIMAAEANYSPNDVTEYEETGDPSVLARITCVRDNAHERATFTLKRDSEVRIYAIGEGSDGDMYDYGWIEDAHSGRAVWEMSYRMTGHAGGAKKNRLYDGTLMLKAGEYTVYYESDGSHSFNDWNASPPHDPMQWGIAVYLVQ
jgi:hypothetical protein